MGKEDIIILKDDNFEEEVLKSTKPVLVDFWAEWCGPCRMVAPIIEELAEAYKDKVKVAKLNVDENKNIPTKYGIRSIPTLLLFLNGEVVDQIIGAVPKNNIESILKKVI
jgi:thioredoxin 1